MTRAERARWLADRYPAAKEALEFYGQVADFSGDWLELRDLVNRIGPPILREAARKLTPERIEQEPDGFFARILARQSPPQARTAVMNECPQCGQPPQCGALRPEGDGAAFHLVCSLCRHQWRFLRSLCTVCGETAEERLIYYSLEGIPHIQTRVCDTCGKYMHVIHLGKDPLAIPDVDEIAGLPMDVWAAEQGFEKIHPNLIGI
jgi:hypothetical protein